MVTLIIFGVIIVACVGIYFALRPEPQAPFDSFDDAPYKSEPPAVPVPLEPAVVQTFEPEPAVVAPASDVPEPTVTPVAVTLEPIIRARAVVGSGERPVSPPPPRKRRRARSTKKPA